jgi:hypothetical protein
MEKLSNPAKGDSSLGENLVEIQRHPTSSSSQRREAEITGSSKKAPNYKK